MPRDLWLFLAGSMLIAAVSLMAGELGAGILIGYQALLVAIRATLTIRAARRRPPPRWSPPSS